MVRTTQIPGTKAAVQLRNFGESGAATLPSQETDRPQVETDVILVR